MMMMMIFCKIGKFSFRESTNGLFFEEENEYKKQQQSTSKDYYPCIFRGNYEIQGGFFLVLILTGKDWQFSDCYQ